MRSASAALAGVALALGACQPGNEAAVRARPGDETAAPIEQPRAEAAADAEGDSAPQEPVAAPEIGRTFVFDCVGDVSFTVRFGPGEMALWAPESLGATYQVLSVARSGSSSSPRAWRTSAPSTFWPDQAATSPRATTSVTP